MYRFILILFLVVFTPAFAETIVPQSTIQIDMSFAPVVKKVKPSVVNIYTKQIVQQNAHPLFADPFFGQMFGGMQLRPRVESSLGSGVIVRADGLVVTNAHVAKNADEIRVALADRREFPAKIVLADEKTDLALLKIESDEKFPVLDFANSDALEVGDIVLAVGNPFGVGQTVTSGIVSGLARTNIGNGFGYYIQTDAAINPGNSGGALVNAHGQVVGINTMIFSKTGGYMGIGFAVPSNLVRQTIMAYEQGGKVRRPFLGAALQNMTAEIAETLGINPPRGALVQRVFDETPAAKAGLKRGDVILDIDGKEVTDAQTLRYVMATIAVGRSVPLRVLRRGDAITLSLPIRYAPENKATKPVTLKGASPLTGTVVRDIAADILEEMEDGMSAMPESGVVIVRPAGLLARMGLVPGDIIVSVNGTDVQNAAHLQKLAAARATSWVIVLTRGSQTLTLRVN